MAVIVKQGPCGGLGGSAGETDDAVRILKIRIGDSLPIIINAIQVFYEDSNGVQKWSPVWGNNNGQDLDVFQEIDIPGDEYLKMISGYMGRADDTDVITSLTITTNLKTHGPYGANEGRAFTLDAGITGEIVGFFVYSGDLLDAIGIYVKEGSPAATSN